MNRGWFASPTSGLWLPRGRWAPYIASISAAYLTAIGLGLPAAGAIPASWASAVAVAQPERGAKRIALRAGKALDAIQERRAQLLQPRIRELHLRLDSGRPGDAAPRQLLRQILQQHTLANPGNPTQHQRPA